MVLKTILYVFLKTIMYGFRKPSCMVSDLPEVQCLLRNDGFQKTIHADPWDRGWDGRQQADTRRQTAVPTDVPTGVPTGVPDFVGKS